MRSETSLEGRVEKASPWEGEEPTMRVNVILGHLMYFIQKVMIRKKKGNRNVNSSRPNSDGLKFELQAQSWNHQKVQEAKYLCGVSKQTYAKVLD